MLGIFFLDFLAHFLRIGNFHVLHLRQCDIDAEGLVRQLPYSANALTDHFRPDRTAADATQPSSVGYGGD
jgi:hypothetical protein